MNQDTYDAMVVHLARVLCANSNIATRESPVPVYDVPDDLVWLESPDGPVLAARWRLYEERARIALDVTRYVPKEAALYAILEELRTARSANRLPDFALIEKVATSAFE